MFHTLALIHNHCLCLVVDSGQLPPNKRWLGNDWEKSEKKPISPFQQNIGNMYQVNYLQMLYQRDKSTRILRETISYLLCLSLVWTLNKKCQTTYAVFYDRNFAYIFFLLSFRDFLCWKYVSAIVSEFVSKLDFEMNYNFFDYLCSFFS